MDIQKSKVKVPVSMDGCGANAKIIENWKIYQQKILKRIQYDHHTDEYMESYMSNIIYTSELEVSFHEVHHIVNKLKNNQTCSCDKLYAEIIKYATSEVLLLLSMCFSSMLIHSHLLKKCQKL